MALDGKPPKDIPSVSPTGAYLARSLPLLGDTERKGLLGVQGRLKKLALSCGRKVSGCLGYQKKACPSWFQIRERQGTGATGLPKLKKAVRLQVYLLSLDNVPTHVPCLVHTHVHACVYACPCLPWSVPGLSWRYKEKGSGSHWFNL